MWSLLGILCLPLSLSLSALHPLSLSLSLSLSVSLSQKVKINFRKEKKKRKVALLSLGIAPGDFTGWPLPSRNPRAGGADQVHFVWRKGQMPEAQLQGADAGSARPVTDSRLHPFIRAGSL